MRQKTVCNLPEFEALFIETRDVVTIAQYDAWFAAKDDAVYAVVPQVLGDWNLTGADGNPLPKPSELKEPVTTIRTLVDIRVAAWLLQSVTNMLNERVKLPLAKTSGSPASP